MLIVWVATPVPNSLPAPAVNSFPAEFLWGAATAAHQVEGGNTKNDWAEWERSGKVPFPSGNADEAYERYDEDFALAQSMAHNATRLSVEWSRIEPRAGEWDEAEVEHYRQVLQSAKRHGLKVFLTLHHFTSPQWIADQGGWESEQTVVAFDRFTGKIVQALGEYVDYWITINEPNVYALTGYVAGVTPPGKKNITLAGKVLANFLKAHARAYHRIHRVYPQAKVSFSHHMRVFEPASAWNPIDHLVACEIHSFWNLQILDSIQEGRIKLGIPFLFNVDEAFPELKGTLDYIGVNYYTRDLVTLDLSSANKIKIVPKSGVETNDLGWEIYPQGIRRVLKSLKKYQLPVIVTENGLADAADSRRKAFLCSHLQEMQKAMHDGLDVRGYLHWSLIDNFEWVSGFEPRFGLVAVDYATQRRTIRPSGLLYQDIIQKRNVAETCTSAF